MVQVEIIITLYQFLTYAPTCFAMVGSLLIVFFEYSGEKLKDMEENIVLRPGDLIDTMKTIIR